ncbi:DUF6082 family protein [Actinoplanes sp. NPDC000266]
MAARELQAEGAPVRRSINILAYALVLLVAAGVAAGVIASPAVMRMIYVEDRDYSAVADVGQAYGGAAAVISCIALFVVVASVAMQFVQLKGMRRDAFMQFNEDLVRLAMENPKYRQCWGARMSPDGVDEDLFYYCGKVIKSWSWAYEIKKIDETRAREYLEKFFESEVPRLYWQHHGDWHRRGGSREGFPAFVNDEYFRALASGPPKRKIESFAAPSA